MIDQRTKTFKDNVHGYIDIPIEYVDAFIDTELFQRLRRIEQTGMRILYPSARHDRFIHSLGTFYLGKKAFACFRKNVFQYQGRNYSKVFEDEKQNERFWDFCEILFEVACLLHDCGHAPFSHTLEFHYAKESVDGESLPLKEKLKETVKSERFTKDFSNQGAPHELMSALLVCTGYKSALQEILKKYDLFSDKIEDATEFVVRMIIGCKYDASNSLELQIRNCLIELLNSKSIDVDSLDYIIRDSKLSGVDNMNIDVDRLLGSLTVVEETVFEEAELRESELVTNIIEGRLQKGNDGKIRVEGKCSGSLKLNETKCRVRGEVDLTGSFCTEEDTKFDLSEQLGDSAYTINGYSYLIKDGVVDKMSQPATVHIKGCVETLAFQGTQAKFERDTNAYYLIESGEVGFSANFVSARVTGVFTGRVLGNFENLGGKPELKFGFHKSCLSVIQNVVLARNYEYQWIYSHHKVAYYANYLIVDLLKLCTDYLLHPDDKEKQQVSADDALARILSWETMITFPRRKGRAIRLDQCELFRPCDADIMAVFKRCYILLLSNEKLSMKEERLLELLTEYYTRKYKVSLWKSFAEFNIFFADFTAKQRRNIFSLIKSNSVHTLPNQYGYFNDEWQKQLDLIGMKNTVWVNGNAKLKELDMDNTYIWFKTGAMTYRTVCNTSGAANQLKSSELFYLYYSVDSERQLPFDEIKHNLLEFLSEKLKSFSKFEN